MQESVKPKLGFGNSKAKNRKMNKVLKLIAEKKLHIERVIRKAELIKQPSKSIEILLKDYKDELFQLTKAELLLKEETAKDLKKHDFLCECNTCIEQRAKAC